MIRWPWRKRTPPLQIPPYRVPVSAHPKPKADGIEVEELDASAVDDDALAALRIAQSSTGMHRAWKRLTGSR
jgi:hypothetical protein